MKREWRLRREVLARSDDWRTRALLRLPVLLYCGRLAELLRDRCVMPLTTAGRRTGRPRTRGVSFTRVDGRYVVFAGLGARSDWYRNLRADPCVTLQVGRRRTAATARLVDEPGRRAAPMRHMRERSIACGPPRVVRPLLRAARVFDDDRGIALAVALGGALPVVELCPTLAERDRSVTRPGRRPSTPGRSAPRPARSRLAGASPAAG